MVLLVVFTFRELGYSTLPWSIYLNTLIEKQNTATTVHILPSWGMNHTYNIIQVKINLLGFFNIVFAA